MRLYDGSTHLGVIEDVDLQSDLATVRINKVISNKYVLYKLLHISLQLYTFIYYYNCYILFDYVDQSACNEAWLFSQY